MFYLSGIGGDAAGHDAFQVAAETDTFHRDDGFLSQYRPRRDNGLK